MQRNRAAQLNAHDQDNLTGQNAIKLEREEEDEFVQLNHYDCFETNEVELPSEMMKLASMDKKEQQHQHHLTMPLRIAKRQTQLPLSRKALLQSIVYEREQLNAYFQKQVPKPTFNATTTNAKLEPKGGDSYALFFESACASIKSLPPKLAAEAKSRISQIITEFELRAISEEEALQAKHIKASVAKYEASNEPIVDDDDSDIAYKFQAYT